MFLVRAMLIKGGHSALRLSFLWCASCAYLAFQIDDLTHWLDEIRYDDMEDVSVVGH